MNEQKPNNEGLLSEEEEKKRQKENRKERRIAIILGTVSPLFVIMAQLINLDPTSLHIYADTGLFIGYAIRVSLLMALGAFVIFANKNVKDRWVAIQIGIMAPAIILSLLNGSNLKNVNKDLTITQQQLEDFQADKDKDNNKCASSNGYNNYINVPDVLNKIPFSIARSAHAQTHNELPKGWHKNPPSFIVGLIGSTKNTWFVIVGSHKSKQSAENQEEELKDIGYKAKVFPPFKNSEYYGVMIGSFLNLDEARALKEKAIKDGLPKDTYLWKY